MLDIQGLCFKYQDKEVLREISLHIRPGEVVCIAGSNGSGKTTLLRCILHILKPCKGKILSDGQDLSRVSSRERARQMSYVPQNSHSRFPVTVFDMVLMGRRPYLSWRPSDSDLVKVTQLLEMLGLEEISMQEFDRLSGGQQQKVMLARAFAQEASYMLLDEPTSSLDLKHQLEVMDLLRHMTRDKEIGTVIAIHDLSLAHRYSDQVAFMEQGRILDKGDPNKVMTPEAIERVYGVRVRYISDNGNKYLVPVGTLKPQN